MMGVIGTKINIKRFRKKQKIRILWDKFDKGKRRATIEITKP